MDYKDILLTLMTHPDPTPNTAIDEAIDFSAMIGARISAIACAIKFRIRGGLLGDLLLDIPAMVATETERSSANAETLLQAFQTAAEKRGVFQERILEHCYLHEVPSILVEYTRLRDLTIVPAPVEGEFFDRSYTESMIFGSGRPILLIPQTRRHVDTFALDTVVVAWDFSRPAARAVADSLPILQRAKVVCIVTVTNEKVIDTKQSGAELARYLARHSVEVVLDSVDAAGRAIGDVLQSYATSRNADLVVMGAYGHSRVRDFILGGATKSMIARPPLPILLSH